MNTTLATSLWLAAVAGAGSVAAQSESGDSWIRVVEDNRAIKVETDKLEAVIPKKNPKQWMTAFSRHTFTLTIPERRPSRFAPDR